MVGITAEAAHASPVPSIVLGLGTLLLILGFAWRAWRALGDDEEAEPGGSDGRQLLTRKRRKKPDR